MSSMPASIRARNAVTIVGVLVVLIGPVAYFVAFLFAYAFSDDSISPAQHALFLAEIAAIATVIALVATPFVRASAAIPLAQAFEFAISTSIAINLTVVGIGSIVSATNADQNSVTAQYPWTTDALLAAGLFGLAAVAGRIAVRLRPR